MVFPREDGTAEHAAPVERVPRCGRLDGRIPKLPHPRRLLGPGGVLVSALQEVEGLGPAGTRIVLGQRAGAHGAADRLVAVERPQDSHRVRLENKEYCVTLEEILSCVL